MDCLNVKLHASSYYQLNADSNNTDYKWGFAHISVNTNQAGVIVIKPLTKWIDELEVQAIHFRDLNLLKESRLSYCINKNQLLIKKELLSHSEDISFEKLDIELESYWNYEKERSNYIFYDQFDNLITPLLTNDFINSLKSLHPITIAECFQPQKFLLNRVLNLTDKNLLNVKKIKNLFSVVELEEAIENLLYNETIIGPFELNPNLKPLSFVDIQPYNYTLTMGNSDKNIFNLISNKNKLGSFYGDKDEDHYFLNLHDIRGEKLIKINNYDSDSSIDRLEIYTNHSHYELCIDKRVNHNNNFIFYIINRYEEKHILCSTEEQPVCCSSNSTGPHVAKLLLHNYLLSDVYQHIEICISEENQDIKCFIPFLDKDKKTKPLWFFKRYFRNPHDEEAIFKLDPDFMDIIVEGDVKKFEAIQREQDLILRKSKKNGGTGYNSLSLWFPNYHVNPGKWDLFHLYSTQNATIVNSKMRDLDNNFFREISKIAIDYHSLKNNIRFYELSFEDQNSNFIISHNQLQSNIISRNRRDMMLSISKLVYDIGYLKISKNESFSLIDIKLESYENDLYLSIYMNQTSISTAHSYSVIVQNWNKPEYRLAGFLYRDLSILNLDKYDLKPTSLRWMQTHIHEKILEHNIHTILESDLETKLIWDKLRVFLLLPLPSKNYDTLEIMIFMQKILDFENTEELLDFLPDTSEDSRSLINNLYRQITENETLAKKIKSYLVYHVIKASFFEYRSSKKIIKDSFPMLPGSLIDSIYSNIRNKLINGHLWQTSEYIEAVASTAEDQIILNEWLNILSTQSSDFLRQKRTDKAKELVLPLVEKNILISDRVRKNKKQNSRIEGSDNFKRFKPIIREEALTSSATQSEGWLNSLFKYFLKVKSDFNPPVFALDRPKDIASKDSIMLDHCIPGVRFVDSYREEGITCYSKNMKVVLFPKENRTIIAPLADRYSKPLCPIEFNGRPAVYFEGEQTHAFYIPEIPENPLDQFNDKLILLQVLLHEGKKVYHWFKNFFTGKSDQSECLAEEFAKISINNPTKILWKERLNQIEKQLSDVNRLVRGKVDLRWIKHILEDRKEEFNYLNQLTEQNSEITNAFIENLQALQAELSDIKENICFVRKTENTDNFTYKKDVGAYRPNQCFFNIPKESLSIVDCNVIGLNSRRLELKPNELNTLVPFFLKK